MEGAFKGFLEKKKVNELCRQKNSTQNQIKVGSRKKYKKGKVVEIE